MSNIIAVFQSFRCTNCDTFFSRTFKLELFLTTCSERKKNIFARNVYQIRETLSDKQDYFGIKYTSQQILAEFDLESICVQEESFNDTKTTTSIDKHVPISVFIPKILRNNQFFSTTLILTTSFHRLLEHWKVWRSKVKHKWNYCSLMSRQQLILGWAVSWRNLPNVITDEIWHESRWLW